MALVKVRVLYFAQAREAAGAAEEKVLLKNPASADQLYTRLSDNHPKLTRLKEVVSLAVNQRIIDGNVELKDGDEVAVLPPVAGG